MFLINTYFSLLHLDPYEDVLRIPGYGSVQK